MRIGHYELEDEIRLIDSRFDPPTAVTVEFRQRYGYPGITDEDLFCLIFFDFSHSVKVARLDECPLSPQQVHKHGAAVYERAREERARRSRERGKRRRAMGDYKELCETMFQNWKDRNLVIPKGFLPDHAPEPYLAFGYGSLEDLDGPALIFLTTNPGDGRDEQKRENVVGDTYAAFQSRLARTVYPNLSGSAGSRIRRMRDIAEGLFGSPNFIQCEVVPFHSASLPNKPKLNAELARENRQGLMSVYLARLSDFLKGHHVIALDATNNLGAPARLWSGWIKRKADLFDFHPQDSGEPFSKQSAAGNDSVHLYHHQKGGLIRAYYLTRGTNNFGINTQGVVDAIRTDGPL